MRKISTLTSFLILAAALSGGSYATPSNRYSIKRVKSTGARISANTGHVPSFSLGSTGVGAIRNVIDTIYTVDITICGQVINLAIDTGSTGEALVLHLTRDIV